jgi:hypothetical protein
MSKWRMAGGVIAAWIAAGAAVAVAVVNLVVTLRTERQRRDAELIVAALEHFQGGSQPRSVGIAALKVLDGRAGWELYRDTVAQLFYRQLLYLFAQGKNRWQAHEISNIEGMTQWLFAGDLPVTLDMRQQLDLAMERYKKTWKERQELPEDKRADDDPEAIKHLVGKIAEWQRRLRVRGSIAPADDLTQSQ